MCLISVSQYTVIWSHFWQILRPVPIIYINDCFVNHDRAIRHILATSMASHGIHSHVYWLREKPIIYIMHYSRSRPLILNLPLNFPFNWAKSKYLPGVLITSNVKECQRTRWNTNISFLMYSRDVIYYIPIEPTKGRVGQSIFYSFGDTKCDSPKVTFTYSTQSRYIFCSVVMKTYCSSP